MQMNRMPWTLRAAGALLGLALWAAGAAAQTVAVRDAWVRAAVPGQSATGAFMKLTASSATRLVAVQTPAAGMAEVHDMKMVGDVMQMRALPDGLALPAGQTVELKPGGHHVMLMDLKAPLPKDSKVAMTLVFKDAKGVETRQTVQVPVGLAAPLQSGKP
jgi:copper(I)-binding protein